MQRYFLFCLLCALFSCTGAHTLDHGDPHPVNIRIHNISTVVIDSVRVNFDFKDGLINFGTLIQNEFTDYRFFEMAFPPGSIGMLVEGKMMARTQVDRVGEKWLEAGDYTCQIDVDLQTESISTNLVKDE